MAILKNILSELANSYIVPKENIAKFYGLTEDTKELSDTEVISSLISEVKSIPTTRKFKYRADMVPVVMKESDENVSYFINYHDLSKYADDQNINIMAALSAVCSINNFDSTEEVHVCFDSGITNDIKNVKSLIFESQNIHNKLYNKMALSDLLSDIQDLSESGVMLRLIETEEK